VTRRLRGEALVQSSDSIWSILHQPFQGFTDCFQFNDWMVCIPALEKFEQFIKERIYLKNVSPRTVEWYREAFKWLGKFPLTEPGLKEFVIAMRRSGLKPISCNGRIRVANAFLKWLESPLKLSRLKEEEKIPATFQGKDVTRLLSWKPTTATGRRLHTIVSTLLDTGLRVDEALSLRFLDVDLDNLLLTVHGKGNKQRKVPISRELRKILWRYLQGRDSRLLFCTRDGTKLGRRDLLRDLKILCRKLGFEPPERTVHALRHSFAMNYVRMGGSQFHLMKILGHTSMEMTRKYVNLQTEDLQAVHNDLSMLSARR
jgi:integrase/recombinase XerD